MFLGVLYSNEELVPSDSYSSSPNALLPIFDGRSRYGRRGLFVRIRDMGGSLLPSIIEHGVFFRIDDSSRKVALPASWDQYSLIAATTYLSRSTVVSISIIRYRSVI